MSNLTNIEDYLKKNGTLTYTFRGTSMYPLLKQGRDLFTVTSKTSERCNKYDVVLYRGPEHKYILHRVIKVCRNDYIIQGDNCITKEYGVRDEDIIGVMTSFQHKGKTFDVSDRKYLLYVHIWTTIHPLITLVRRFKSSIARMIRRCLR